MRAGCRRRVHRAFADSRAGRGTCDPGDVMMPVAADPSSGGGPSAKAPGDVSRDYLGAACPHAGQLRRRVPMVLAEWSPAGPGAGAGRQVVSCETPRGGWGTGRCRRTARRADALKYGQHPGSGHGQVPGPKWGWTRNPVVAASTTSQPVTRTSWRSRPQACSRSTVTARTSLPALASRRSNGDGPAAGATKAISPRSSRSSPGGSERTFRGLMSLSPSGFG